MSIVPIKTPQALRELGGRERALSQRHRTTLLLVDGVRTATQIRQLALQAGCPDTCFDDLLAQGMVAYSETSDFDYRPSHTTTAHAPLAADDSVLSLLPASQTLHPSTNDSILTELPSTEKSLLPASAVTTHDDLFEEARMILIQAVRAEAPVAGALTIMRLRRVTSRPELEGLLTEVELRITKPFKGLWATQTMARVRGLLADHSNDPSPGAPPT
jgi:hypothetical protein